MAREVGSCATPCRCRIPPLRRRDLGSVTFVGNSAHDAGITPVTFTGMPVTMPQSAVTFVRNTQAHWGPCAVPSGVPGDPAHAPHAHPGGRAADRLVKPESMGSLPFVHSACRPTRSAAPCSSLATAPARQSRSWSTMGMATGCATSVYPAGALPCGRRAAAPRVRYRPASCRCCSWAGTRAVLPRPRRGGA